MTFDADALALERGIVVEENRRDRDSAMARISDRLRVPLGGGWRRSQRASSGVDDIIAGASRDAVMRFYRDWYRPDLMAVIVVGDIDPAAMEATIRARFADWRFAPWATSASI